MVEIAGSGQRNPKLSYFNPIETLWSILKDMVTDLRPGTTTAVFIQKVETVETTIDLSVLRNLMTSKTKRMRLVLKMIQYTFANRLLPLGLYYWFAMKNKRHQNCPYMDTVPVDPSIIRLSIDVAFIHTCIHQLISGPSEMVRLVRLRLYHFQKAYCCQQFIATHLQPRNN